MPRVLGRGMVVAFTAAFGAAGASQLVGGCGSAFDDGLTQTDGAAGGDGSTTIIVVVGPDGGAVTERDGSVDGMSDATTGGNPGDPGTGDAAASGDAGCGSTCRPTPTPIANPPHPISRLAATEDNVVWLDGNGLYITPSVPVATSGDASAARFMALASPSGLAVSPTFAYVTRSADDVDANLLGVSLGNDPAAHGPQNTPLGSVALVGTSVFTTATTASPVSQWSTFLTTLGTVPSISSATDLYGSNGRLYWTSSGMVYACDPASCAPTALFSVPSNKLYAGDVNRNVFWVNDGTLYGCNSDHPGDAPSSILTTTGSVTAIASDGTHLYWADSSAPGIFTTTLSVTQHTLDGTVSIAGNGATKLADGSDSVIGMAVNSKSLFWSQGVTTPVIYSLERSN